MKTGMIPLTLILLALFNIVPAFAEDPRARAVMERVDARDDGDNQTAEMTMVLIDRRGKERIRKIASFARDFGEDTHKLMFFRHPADVKKTGFMTFDLDDPDRDDDQWLYLPALRKTKRIASADKSGSFMGSDLNYSDMTRRNLDDFDFTFYPKKKEAAVRGHKVWLIDAVPRSKEVVAKTGYARQLLFVRQDNDLVVRSVLWEETAGMVKYMDARTVKKIDGIWVVTERTVTRKKNGQVVHRTILSLENVRFDQGLDPSMFSIRQLERGI